MDGAFTEQARRREAIRRRLAGQKRTEICKLLHRTTRWFDKWWRLYREHPTTQFADGSRTPHRSPYRLSSEVERMIVAVRRAREAASQPDTRYGFIGPRAVQTDLDRLGLRPLPSLASIQRVMARHGLTHRCGRGVETAYYPEPMAGEPNAIHALDIITRHLKGGAEIQNLHTIDHFSQAVHLSQALDKTTETVEAHLLDTWADLGLPWIQQLDNEGTFRGGHTHPRVIGQVVRLCLFCGIEPLFIPDREPKRNHRIETFHSVWLAGFWSRRRFRNLAHVREEVPAFVHYYHHIYRPPSLEGKTPAQMRRGFQPVRLTPVLRRLIPTGRLPITEGRIHFIRRVDGQGLVSLLNDTWLVGQRWIGEYVWATIDTATQRLTLWHWSGAHAKWQHVTTFRFRITEPVCPLRLEFQRKSERCPEQMRC